KWYATVCYEVEDTPGQDDGRVLGADMNVRQVTAHTGAMLVAPNLARLEARRRRYQRIAARRRKGSKRQAIARHLAARTGRKLAQTRRAWRHRATRVLADSAALVVMEDLKTHAMTASAKGTAEAPGTNVKAKAGLNREIQATGWGEMKAMLAYKANAIETVNPAYTSQRCAACGHTGAQNRTTQARFACRACGHRDHADVNAAKNILASATGAAGRGEALALATSTIRQQVSERDIVKLWI
ncbi:MAG: transposase, partial [Gammaproteobacteria bacterium]|nr:transposase [Gammaproteobacteria bacterium]